MKICSINEFGNIEYLTRKNFKLLHIKPKYVYCDRLSLENSKLYYLAKKSFFKKYRSLKPYFKSSEFIFVFDFMGNCRVLLDNINFAQTYNSFSAFFQSYTFSSKDLKLVECSRLLLNKKLICECFD